MKGMFNLHTSQIILSTAPSTPVLSRVLWNQAADSDNRGGSM